MLICQIYASVLDTSYAEVAKLVDVLALGASGVTHGGSSPLLGTRIREWAERKRWERFRERTRSPIEPSLERLREQVSQSGY